MNNNEIMDNNKLENEKSMREFLTKKYWIELLFMTVILMAIFFFRWFCFIDNAIVGTLLGATIGYFAATIRKIHG